MTTPDPPGSPARWLVLTYQLPAHAGALRVKIWRRLQGIGAVAVRNALYVLPLDNECREDLAWVLKEILAAGAEGAILEAVFVDGMDDAHLRAQFVQARNADYQALLEEVSACMDTLPGGTGEEADGARQQLSRFRRRHAEIVALDFFGAAGRQAVEARLAELETRISELEAPPVSRAPGGTGSLHGRTWVTRSDVHVDRIASAWLIRRFIDPAAVFRFTPDRHHAPGPGEVRFDMFEAEYTHVGDRCTFEVLAELAEPGDPALRRVARIIHDIDLKDGKFGCEETPGIARLVAGIIAGTTDDMTRIERGAAMLENLYTACAQPAA